MARNRAPEGSAAVRRIPFGEYQGESVQASCCPLWGWCSAQRIKIAMIAGGNHTSVSCRVSGKRGVVGDFELLPFIELHPLSQAVRPASSPIGEPRGILRIRPGYHKHMSACRNPSVRPFGPASSPSRGARIGQRSNQFKGESICATVILTTQEKST